VTLLDLVVARRAAEQVAAAKIDRRWERDSWAIAGEEPKPAPKPRPTACRAPGCPRAPRSSGLCHTHNRRLARGLPLEWDDSEPGRRSA
jgi:hypothetical protein